MKNRSPSAVGRDTALYNRRFGPGLKIPNDRSIRSVLKSTGERESEREVTEAWTEVVT